MLDNSVLCAIDVNDFDQDIIDLAAHFAKQFGAELHVLHVTLTPDPMKAAWPAFVGAPDELVRDHKLLRQVGTSVPDVKIQSHQLAGMPVEKVVEFVQRQSPRLLVLGTHAKTGLNRMLGSISSKILRRVSCPVMLARQRKNSHDDNAIKSESSTT